MKKNKIIPFMKYVDETKSDIAFSNDEIDGFKKVKKNDNLDKIILTQSELEHLKLNAFKEGMSIGQNELEAAMKLAEKSHQITLQDYKENIADYLMNNISQVIETCFQNLLRENEKNITQVFSYLYTPNQIKKFIDEFLQAFDKLNKDLQMSIIISCSNNNRAKINEMILIIHERNNKINFSIYENESPDIKIELDKTIFSSAIAQWQEFIISVDKHNG